MSSSDKRIEALLRYHAERPKVTLKKLHEALDRMETRTTIILTSDFKWTKTNLALEAGLSIHTLVSKDKKTGEWRFPDINARFEKVSQRKLTNKKSEDDKDWKIDELRIENRQLKTDKANLAIEADRLGILLLETQAEIERLMSVEEQNIQLREEVRKLKFPGPVKM